MFALRESLANWASRPLLNATLAGLVAALLIAVAYIEIAAAEDAQSASDELVSDGYTTLLVGRNEQLQPKLSATDCAALDTTAGIVAATWSAEGSPTQLWSPNGPKLPTTVAGPGMLNLLAASPSALGAWTGEQLFIDATSDIASNSALTAVAFEPNTDGVPIALLPTNLAILGQGATAGLVEIGPSDDRAVDGCVLLTNRTDRDTVRTGIESAFPAEQGYSLQWALPNADRFDDPIITYRDRPSRYAWLVTLAAGLVLTGFTLRLRRTDHTFYSIAGLDRRRLRTLVLIETLGPIAVATLIAIGAFAISTAVHGAPGGIAAAGWTPLLRTLTALVLSTVALCSLTIAMIDDSAQATLKDR